MNLPPLKLAGMGLGLLILAQIWASFFVFDARPQAQRQEQESFFAELPAGEIAGTLMLGGFRGMAIDFLWLRAIQAKNDARYYESVALFDLISRVQPRFERVWEYMAWDMAYNIGHYVDQKDDKWSWYLAGLKANLRGVQVNPSSERLLRHLAWMFFHKGETYMERIESVTWQPIIEAAVKTYQSEIAMPMGKQLSSFQLAEYFYRLSVLVADREESRQPVFVRRMVALAIDRDANRVRNRGQHFLALQRYVEALQAWQDIIAWSQNPSGYHRGQLDIRLTDESYQRNEGGLRRKMSNLGKLLAKESKTGEAFAQAAMKRDIKTCHALMAQSDLWNEHIETATIQWLDE